MTDAITLTASGTVQGGGNYMDSVPLTKAHWHELTVGSAIDPAVIAERGYVSIDRPRSKDSDAIPTLPHFGAVGDRRDQLKAMGFPGWVTREDSYFPMLWLPKWSPAGVRNAGQVKPWRPVSNKEGKTMRYASARGATGLDVHPRWSADRGLADPTLVPWIQDPARPLWITEGVKKADSLTSRDVCTVALDGVYNWRNSHATLGDWEDVKLRGREVYIAFDADTTEKPAVQQAMIRLGRWLRYKGVAKVWYLVVPAAHNGTPTKGVDDFFAAGGTVNELERAATEKPPRADSTEDRFTDSALAERVVVEALTDRYMHVTNLGWHAYDGRLWTPCPDAVVLEAVREYARDEYRWALDEESKRVKAGKASDPYEVDGWRKVQSASRLSAVLRLAAGNAEIIRSADQLDGWPDLLNTPGGVVDLTTATTLPHDPAYLFTKMTAVDYAPDATSAWFSKALEAVPAEAHSWLRARLGQAITGYEPDDDKAVLMTGGGENAKTTLMQGIFSALGGYAASVPNTLLLRSSGGSKGNATPEKMTLRGVRLAYIEETPEGRFLDTQALKEVVGTPTINGRELYKGFVTFGASHSLFINTNHLPIVAETDHATWRRLACLDFPYTFKASLADITDPETQRVGDPRVKANMGTEDAQRAALAWLVEGARRWYESGKVLKAEPVPECVEKSTRTWRTDSDLILAFMDDTVEIAPDSWIATVDLYAAYDQWCKVHGNVAPADRVFSGAFLRHPEVPRSVTKRQMAATAVGRSRQNAWLMAGAAEPKRTWAYLGIRFAKADN